MSQFIPHFHFLPAEKKLTKEWCNDIIGHYVYQNNLTNLLWGKNIKDIEGYATGDYDLKPFKKMFRSLRSQMAQQNNPNIPKDTLDNLDTTGISWERVALIPPKLNAAIATLQKIPIEITATCTDPLAQKKKKEDLEFLRNKPLMEDALQPLYDSMNLGAVDMGATKHSSRPFTSLPLDLDIEDDDEFMMFANLMYNLAPESAFEVILQAWGDIKKLNQIRLMEIRDQYYYAVSVNRGFGNKMTGLPDAEYIYPGEVTTDGSMLPDFSDNIVRIISHRVTPLELFKYFPDEICDEKQLEEIVSGGISNHNGWETQGYCGCNNRNRVNQSDWGTFKMQLEYVEVKSVDSAMIATKTTKRDSYKYFTNDEKKCTDKVWGQNTYCFYWLRNTKYFFGIDRLGFAHRAKGNEVYTTFSTNIYKSQEKSAVELSIGENKKAQIADIKLQHSVIMSSPPGKVIDMKYIRNAIESLTEEMGQYTQKQLLDYAMEKNVHIIDTEGYENKQTGQYLPVRDLPGGLKNDIEGYYRVILEANAKIDMFTNINPQLTGQAANPEGLVGLQKLLVNASMNGLYYVNVAILSQYEGLYNTIAYYVKQAIEKGGAARKAIENIIGTNKVEVIDNMQDIPIHQIGIKISLGQREEERSLFKGEVGLMRREGKIDTAAEYYILSTPNPKDAMLLAAMYQRKFDKRQDMIRQEQNAAQQQIVEQQGQNVITNTQQQVQGKAALIQEEGKVEAQLMQWAAQLGLNQQQVEGLIKRQLQADRLQGQTDKSLKTLYAKQNVEQQQPLI
jgi:hypothetical protein